MQQIGLWSPESQKAKLHIKSPKATKRRRSSGIGSQISRFVQHKGIDPDQADQQYKHEYGATERGDHTFSNIGSALTLPLKNRTDPNSIFHLTVPSWSIWISGIVALDKECRWKLPRQWSPETRSKNPDLIVPKVATRNWNSACHTSRQWYRTKQLHLKMPRKSSSLYQTVLISMGAKSRSFKKQWRKSQLIKKCLQAE